MNTSVAYRLEALEKFMEAVAQMVGCLPSYCDSHPDRGNAHIIERLRHLTSELEDLQDKMHKIKTWIDAYPLDIFPEPDFKKAAKVLKENGMILDSISASSMRHVLNGIKDIIKNR